MELKLGLITRARMKKLKASNGDEDNVMVPSRSRNNEKEMKKDENRVKMMKNEPGYLPSTVGDKDCKPSATRDPRRMVGLTLPLAVGSAGKGSSNPFQTRLFTSLLGIEEGRTIYGKQFEVSYWSVEFKLLNRGSSRKGGDLWEGVESKLQSKVDLHQSGIRETSISSGNHGRHKLEVEERGGQEGRGYYTPHEKVPGNEAWHEDNLFEDFGEDPNVGQAYHGGYYGNQQEDKALDKIKWKDKGITYSW
ncbi:hypothetical protein M9H77_23824 [Catharanthus roseus]|uniref:Uncharacterized protein n=1 Tax=Catharanthus roseus TaxID=4058 RepID=A0ACC0AYH0_CATRO|nr:hypothetical protein M9H77_23824 [Catharanthus roseus]